MSKRVRVTDESLNSYGFWVVTGGIDTADFLKNPIMLWNHNRGWRGTDDEVLPIGVWKDLKMEGSEMTALPDIDESDDFAKRVASKFAKGHLRAASIGIQVLEWSDDPSLLKQGQTRPTVTKCKLREISLVDIPSNKNAVSLYDLDGSQIDLSDGALQGLPILDKQNSPDTMEELKILAAQLGLNTATLPDLQAKVRALQSQESEVAALKEKIKAIEAELKEHQLSKAEARKAEVKSLLDAAEQEGRLPLGHYQTFQKLFEADHDAAKAAIEALPKLQKLADFAAGGSPGGEHVFTYGGKTFSQMSKESPKALEALKENDFDTFKKLYKAEFGKDYKTTDR